MKNKRVAVFAKDKYGMKEAVEFLKANFRGVDVFVGDRTAGFPKRAEGREYDICVSYMSPWLIPGELLADVKEFSINFHPGPPEYRGIGCTNFAVYNNESQYGVTAHLMAPAVDSGKIISVRRFPVLPGHSLVDVTNKCYFLILEQFFDVFKHYLRQGSLPAADERWSKRLYTRDELDKLCRIDIGMGLSEIKRRIRATSYPNMPQAYIEIFGLRFEYRGNPGDE